MIIMALGVLTDILGFLWISKLLCINIFNIYIEIYVSI